MVATPHLHPGFALQFFRDELWKWLIIFHFACQLVVVLRSRFFRPGDDAKAY